MYVCVLAAPAICRTVFHFHKNHACMQRGAHARLECVGTSCEGQHMQDHVQYMCGVNELCFNTS